VPGIGSEALARAWFQAQDGGFLLARGGGQVLARGGRLLAHGGAGHEVAPLTPAHAWTAWTLDWVPLIGAVLVGGLYLWGTHRLRARGDRWSRWRSLLFVGLGLGSFLVATESFLGTYDDVLFWDHMLQHMVLSMVTPVFLALGAPITLALRTLPRGGRRTLLAVLHSRAAKILTFPLVSGFLFVATPFALYLTGWYEATLRNPFLHDWTHLHFVVVGCLWFWPLLSPDPMPQRMPYGLRLLAVFVTMPFHAFLGVAIMSSRAITAKDWYAGLHRDWGPSLASDQNTAGAILWSTGDVVALIVLGSLFVQWARASEREAVREDRRLDRLEAEEAAAQARAAAYDGTLPRQRETHVEH
jgi:cytochrome c oxidase assembly factor CtaG